jgi:hypothetical protein
VTLIRARQIALLGATSIFVVAVLLGFGPIQKKTGYYGSSASPSPSRSYDSNMLLTEFKQAQSDQMKEFNAHQKSAAKELKNTQNAKQKAFDLHEKEERQKYFAAEHPGTEKRTYMRALLDRRDVFRKDLSDERGRAKDDSDKLGRALADRQKENLEKFKEALGKGQRPDDSLWPQPGLATQ